MKLLIQSDLFWLVLFSFFPFLINSACNGCANDGNEEQCSLNGNPNNCRNYVNNAVYGCCGIWTVPGMNSTGPDTASALCADGYEICPSASRAYDLGLRRSKCGDFTNNEFFASLQSGLGDGLCNDTGVNDVFGCARENSDNDVWNVGNNNMKLCDGVFTALVSTDSISFSGGAWSFGSASNNHITELSRVTLSDEDYGGVLCCKIETNEPSYEPSDMPSIFPSITPSLEPSDQPSKIPSAYPTEMPSNFPSIPPSNMPSITPSNEPTIAPSNMPSVTPTNFPNTMSSMKPSAVPSNQPSSQPSTQPSVIPTYMPSTVPSKVPSGVPTNIPTNEPTNEPSIAPAPSGGLNAVTVQILFRDTITVNQLLGETVHQATNIFLNNNLDMSIYIEGLEWWLGFDINPDDYIVIITVYSNENDEDFNKDVIDLINSQNFQGTLDQTIDGVVDVIADDADESNKNQTSQILGMDETTFYIIASIAILSILCFFIAIFFFCCKTKRSKSASIASQNEAMIELESNDKFATGTKKPTGISAISVVASVVDNPNVTRIASTSPTPVTSGLLDDGNVAMQVALQQSITDGRDTTPTPHDTNAVAINILASGAEVTATTNGGDQEIGEELDENALEDEIQRKERELQALKHQKELQTQASLRKEKKRNKNGIDDSGDEDSEDMYNSDNNDMRRQTTGGHSTHTNGSNGGEDGTDIVNDGAEGDIGDIETVPPIMVDETSGGTRRSTKSGKRKKTKNGDEVRLD